MDVAALRSANGGKPYAINYFLASPDGGKVAVGISEGRLGECGLSSMRPRGGTKVAGPIDRAEFGATSWSDDSQDSLLRPSEKTRAKRCADREIPGLDCRSWDLKSEPVAILGSTVGHGPEFKPAEFPAIELFVGAPVAAALSINGVQNELAMWLAPQAEVGNPKVTWTKFITRDDGVTSGDMRGSDIFLLSHKETPTFKVLSVAAGQPLSSASVLVPAQPDRVIEGIHAASDALYVIARRGAYSQLLRIPTGTKTIEEVPLPFEGHIDETFSDPRAPGVTITLSSWVVPPDGLRVPSCREVIRRSEDRHAWRYRLAANYVVSDLSAKAKMA